MGMDSVYQKLALIKAAVLGKRISYHIQESAARSREVAAYEHHLLISALKRESRDRDGCFYLTRYSFVKLTVKVNSSAFGNDADLAPTDLYLVHIFAPFIV